MFGHEALSGACRVLEGLVRNRIGCKVRAIDLSLMQRASAHLASGNDQLEARMLGSIALDRALRGISGQVSVLRRVSSSPYRVEYDAVPVEQVANLEKAVPREWINARGNGVTREMLEYLAPLVQGEVTNERENGLPRHLILNP
jgi:6-phosphofructokinase 1